MNSIVKNALLIIIPSAISATISHIVTKKIITDKYEREIGDKIDNEIKKFKKEYTAKMEDEPRRIPQSQLTPEQLKRVVNKNKQAIKEFEEEENKQKMEEDIKKVNNPSPMEEDINDFDDEEDEELYDDDGNLIGDSNDDEGYGDDVVSEEDENRRPFVISQEEFDVDSQYEKSSLKYYEDDKVLANENDYELNIDEIIGLKSLEHFGDMSGDPTIVYVRNIPLNSDYEVQLVHGSFAHLVGDLK